MIDVGAVVAGKFKVVHKLGEGGMGAVFEVENLANGKHFALKTVHPHLMRTDAVLQRFAVEVRASVAVESDHVVNALDAGFDEETKTPWLLLERLQGRTLEVELAERGAMEPHDARWVLEQLGAALVAAHSASPSAVIHLDLKPSNVFLAETRTASRARIVKVLDFGIARFIDGSKTAAELTSKSGTMEWMAPEQFEVGQVRPAADVWSFGLIAFFILTGRCFWKSANVTDTQYKSAAVFAEVVGKPIPSASQRVEELGLGVSLPPGFDAWLARCLAREEGARFKSAMECVPALLAVLPQPGASVAPPAPQERRGETAVGAPSVPRDLPPPAPLRPQQRTERMPEPTPRHRIGDLRPRPPMPPRAPAPARWMLGLGAIPVFGLLLWALSSSRGSRSTEAPTPAQTSATPAPAAPNPAPQPVVPAPRAQPATPVQPTGGCPEGMVYLAGGTFTMGAPSNEQGTQDDERPQHQVTLSPFCLGRTEVTVAEWTRSGRRPSHRESYCNYGRSDRRDHPMNCIDWAEADGYCRSLGQRLPTEAEWEFAASVGGTRPYPWGDAAPSDQLCWRNSGTCRVGSFPRGNTPSGLADLSGNVWEWVSDWYGAYESTNQANPVGANSGNSRVNRGGGWLSTDPAWVRARNRYGYVPTIWSFDLGVRCASGTR